MAGAPNVNFDDGAAYENFMGRWSRQIGAVFLDWLSPPRDARWLDVGCGTGVFTQLVLDRCNPAQVTAVDPAPAQIDYVLKQPLAKRAQFRVGDAMALPFADGGFEIVASALVMNFIPDRPRAVADMRRVTRPGGIVAAYVWDFTRAGSPNWPFGRTMRVLGYSPPRPPGEEDSTRERLSALFEAEKLTEIVTREIEVTTTFPSFEDFWRSQTPSFSPTGRALAAVPETELPKIKKAVRDVLKAPGEGPVTYAARANAIKSRVPG